MAEPIIIYDIDPLHRFPPLLWQVDDGTSRWNVRGNEEEVKVELRVSHPGRQIITRFTPRKRDKEWWRSR